MRNKGGVIEEQISADRLRKRPRKAVGKRFWNNFRIILLEKVSLRAKFVGVNNQ